MAASFGRAWMARVVIITAGVALGLVLGTSTARADSPLDLGEAADKVVSSVAKTTSSVTRNPTSKVRTVVKRATKPVRTVATPVHRITKPVHRATKPVQRVVKRVEHAKPVHRATKPVQRVVKPVKRITQRAEHAKPVHRATKPVQRVVKTVRHTRGTHRATPPKPTTAGSPATTPTKATTSRTADKPQLSSTVRNTTSLTGAVTTDLAAGIVASDRALEATTTPVVTGVTHQLPSPLRPVTDGLLEPVAAVHDTAVGLVDTTLVTTVPSLVDQVTAPLLPVLDDVEHSIPGLPTVPVSPAVPVLPTTPIPTVPTRNTPALIPAVSALTVTADPAAGRDQRRTAGSDDGMQLPVGTAAGLLGTDRATASAVVVSVPATATVASLGGDLLGGLVGGITDNTSVGVGPSGSASATALSLLLLALASSAGAFGARSGSLRVLRPLPQGPFRRAHRPGFSPD